MTKLIRYILLAASLGFSQTPDSTTADSSRINPFKLSLVGGIALSSFGAAYYTVLRNAWWSENGSFHFSNDFDYAANVDKLAHFYGGYLFANGFHDGLKWAGTSELQALWGSSALSTLVQLAIESKDGFAPDYGFSFMDPTSGFIGSIIPVAQHYIPLLRPLRIKFSYWYHHNSYWDMSDQEISTAGYIIDDYRNQDYWFSYNPNSVLPKNLESYWPDFLAPALGISMVSGCLDPGTTCKRRYTLGLDYDLEEQFGQNNPLLRRSLFYLDQYKWPAPSIVLWPDLEFKIAYPMTF